VTQRGLSLEIKVGAFIVTGLLLLVAFLFAIGDFAASFQPGYTIRVRFDSANGIGRGSPVQYAGVEVGKIQDVRLVYEQDPPQVELQIWVPLTLKLRADDDAAISTFGLLGEKYLEITPGSGRGPVLNQQDILVGQPPVSTELVIQRSNEVLTELKQTLAGLNSLVGDPAARVYLGETLQEARDATRNWRVLGERMNMAMTRVESGEGNVGKFLYDDTLHREILGFVQDLREHPWKLFVRQKSKKEESAQADRQSTSAR